MSPPSSLSAERPMHLDSSRKQQSPHVTKPVQVSPAGVDECKAGLARLRKGGSTFSAHHWGPHQWAQQLTLAFLTRWIYAPDSCGRLESHQERVLHLCQVPLANICRRQEGPSQGNTGQCCACR